MTYLILALLGMSAGAFWFDRRSVKPVTRAVITCAFVILAVLVILSSGIPLEGMA